MNKEFEIEPGIIISKLNLTEKDTIIITVDLDRWDIEEAYNMFQIASKAFQNNQIVMTFKGIEIEKLKEKEIYI